jgi:hypothetical protein
LAALTTILAALTTILGFFPVSNEPNGEPLIKVASLALTPNKITEDWMAMGPEDEWEQVKIGLKCKAKKKGKK